MRLICVSLFALLSIPVQAAVTAYISNCCNASSVVGVFNTTNLSKTAQFPAGNGAFDAVFTPDGLYAYISNYVSKTVSVVQTSTWTPVATIAVGYAVQWMAMSPDGTKVYVGSFDSANSTHLVSIGTATNTVQKTLSLNGFQSAMVISPDGKRLYLNYQASNGTLIAVDTQSLSVVGMIPNLSGISVALSHDGKLAYVPRVNSGTPLTFSVAIVDTSTMTIVNSIALSSQLSPQMAAISPDGTLLYVAETPYIAGTSSSIVVIQTSTNKIAGTIALPAKAQPGFIVFSPNGVHALVTDFTRSGIDVINVAQNKVVGMVGTSGSVNGLAISPNGATLLVPNEGNSQAAVVDTSGNVMVQASIGSMGTSSSFPRNGAAAVSPDGARAYFTNLFSNNVSVMDTASKTAVANVYTGSEPLGIVLSPDGSRAYVANSFDNTMTVLNTTTFAITTIAMPKSGYPTSIAITPDGLHVFMTVDNIVPDFGSSPGYVFVVDTTSNAVVQTVLAPYPMGVAISPDGSKAYVVSEYGGTTLHTLSTSTYKYIATLPLGGGGALGPTSAGIAVTPDGKNIFVDDSTGSVVWKIDAASNTPVKTIPVGTVPGQLAVTPDGTQVYAADYQNTSATVIDVVSGSVVKTIPLGSPSYGVALTAK